MVEWTGMSNGVKLREWGQIGVMRTVGTALYTIGPPADSEYAVEPVGVLTITPSQLTLLITSSSIYISNVTN